MLTLGAYSSNDTQTPAFHCENSTPLEGLQAWLLSSLPSGQWDRCRVPAAIFFSALCPLATPLLPSGRTSVFQSSSHLSQPDCTTLVRGACWTGHRGRDGKKFLASGHSWFRLCFELLPFTADHWGFKYQGRFVWHHLIMFASWRALGKTTPRPLYFTKANLHLCLQKTSRITSIAKSMLLPWKRKVYPPHSRAGYPSCHSGDNFLTKRRSLKGV